MPMSNVEVLRAACCVAGADGHIAEREMAWLTKLAEKAGVGGVSLQAMINRACSDRDYAKDQFRFLHTDPKEAMRVLLSVAVADGSLAVREREVLAVIAGKLGLDEAGFEKCIKAAESHLTKRSGGQAKNGSQ